MEFSNRRSVVHGVEGSNLVDTGWRHLEDTGNLVHNANGGETVLALAEVQHRHHGCLLVLWRVSLDDFGNDGFILRGELEGDVWVVVGCVPVL